MYFKTEISLGCMLLSFRTLISSDIFGKLVLRVCAHHLSSLVNNDASPRTDSQDFVPNAKYQTRPQYIISSKMVTWHISQWRWIYLHCSYVAFLIIHTLNNHIIPWVYGPTLVQKTWAVRMCEFGLAAASARVYRYNACTFECRLKHRLEDYLPLN